MYLLGDPIKSQSPKLKGCITAKIAAYLQHVALQVLCPLQDVEP